MIQRLQQLGLVRLLFISFLLSSFTAAWPWPPSLGSIEALVYKRQDDASSSDRSPTSTPASKDSPAAASKTSSSGNKKAASTSSSAGKKAGSSKTTEEPSRTTDIDEQSPAGGVVMITPAPLAAAEYYKIGDKVEFAWNYTSLLANPRAIDVLVTRSAATYTISSNATFEPTGTAVWDTKKDADGQGNLVTDMYTLVIHDSDEEITAVPQPGHLGTFTQFRFGMYIRRPYLPRNEWKCATCSGALSDMDRQTLKLVFGMCTITILSFTWFAGGFGVRF